MNKGTFADGIDHTFAGGIDQDQTAQIYTIRLFSQAFKIKISLGLCGLFFIADRGRLHKCGAERVKSCTQLIELWGLAPILESPVYLMLHLHCIMLFSSSVLTLYQMTKFWTLPKLKVFIDNNINEIENLKFVLGRVENIVRKGENAGYQHFPLSNNVLSYFFWITYPFPKDKL